MRCQVCGEVIVTGMTEAPMSWPIGKVHQGRVLVVYKGLAKAIRRESNQAVCHCWPLLYRRPVAEIIGNSR